MACSAVSISVAVEYLEWAMSKEIPLLTIMEALGRPKAYPTLIDTVAALAESWEQDRLILVTLRNRNFSRDAITCSPKDSMT